MSTDELLLVLKERGLTPAAKGGVILLRGPGAREAATERLLRVVRLHKEALLRRLGGEAATAPRPKRVVPLPATPPAGAVEAGDLFGAVSPASIAAFMRRPAIDRNVREFRLASGLVTGATLAELPEVAGNYPLLAEGWRYLGEAEWRPVVLCNTRRPSALEAVQQESPA